MSAPSIPLTLGPLGDASMEIRRSQPRWLAPDGASLRAGQVFAFFNLVATVRAADGLHDPWPEERTVQIALSAPCAGRLRLPSRSDLGMRDALSSQHWREADVVAHLEDADGEPVQTSLADGEPVQVRLLFLAGQRQGWANETDSVLLPGWNTRARAWWDGEGVSRGLLCLGLCEASTLVRGGRGGFLELFERGPFPAHVAHFSEHPLVPFAPMLIDQLSRSAEDVERIGRELAQSFGEGPPPAPQDWILAGAILRQLTASPFTETPMRLTRRGLEPTPPPRHALVSLAAEPFRLRRHRALGYRIHILKHDLRACGPALRHWLKTRFEPVERDVADIAADYRRLAALARASTGARLMAINRISSSPSETVLTYGGFEPPLSRSLAYVAAKELNLMLEDLAALGEMTIIDADAVAAEIGVVEHAPDGIHFSEEMNGRLREQVLAAMRG